MRACSERFDPLRIRTGSETSPYEADHCLVVGIAEPHPRFLVRAFYPAAADRTRMTVCGSRCSESLYPGPGRCPAVAEADEEWEESECQKTSKGPAQGLQRCAR